MNAPSITNHKPTRAVAGATAVVAAGCGALVLRPFLRTLTRNTTPELLVLFALLLTAGLLWPARSRPESWPVVAVVAAIGIGAFVAARLFVPGQVAAPFGPRPLLLDAFAAVAEEAFFRRLVFSAILAAAAHLDPAGQSQTSRRHLAIA